ncbi:RES family NAD+ phosphorylase [Methylobacterium nodulans]|uniref:RES domain protein n=1 Tax=Methylobacterium nodulans (strain LMG 21967 / CNCM I-2342 / ORS 2060) TaxID=460265 RepID=B8IWA1_METNO|nr:RES family NAD+ phosphorylase [Methylobacterium nodulans]ACL62691.1 RES domain protein [Methylobacterium nodulans ORS 2060]
MAGTYPPANFADARLRLHTVAPGERYGRIYMAKYPDPIGYGKAKSRFSDPRRRKEQSRFGVLYLGETLTVCFLEAALRDRRDGKVGVLGVEETELEDRRYAEIEAATSLRLVDLRENAAVAMGVPTDVLRGTRHTLGRVWSLAFHEHPATPDGIIYPSRLNGQINLAIYGRAVSKLKAVRVRRLIDVAELAPLLGEFQVALLPPLDFEILLSDLHDALHSTIRRG